MCEWQCECQSQEEQAASGALWGTVWGEWGDSSHGERTLPWRNFTRAVGPVGVSASVPEAQGPRAGSESLALIFSPGRPRTCPSEHPSAAPTRCPPSRSGPRPAPTPALPVCSGHLRCLPGFRGPVPVGEDLCWRRPRPLLPLLWTCHHCPPAVVAFPSGTVSRAPGGAVSGQAGPAMAAEAPLLTVFLGAPLAA